MSKILVADDEPPMRQMVRLGCERAGHTVFESGNAPTTIEAYERVKPDLLILDVGMPGGGGPFVLNSLRFGGMRKLCPVLIISGTLDRSADEIKTLLAADRVLPKPFRIADLLTAIKDLLAASAKASGAAAPVPPAPSAPPGFPPPAAPTS